MESQGYTLTVIEDEAVALSGSITTGLESKTPLLIGTILMILLVAAIIAVLGYVVRLHYYQSRLNDLVENFGYEAGEYNHKSIRSIRSQITVLEGIAAAASLSGLVS